MPTTRPPWFAEVGPPSRGRTRKGPASPRQQPDLDSRSVSGWTEGCGILPELCSPAGPGAAPGPRRLGTVAPVLLRTLLALVAGVVLSLAFEPVALPAVVPLAVAGFVLTVRGLRARSALAAGAASSGSASTSPTSSGCARSGTDAWIALSSVEALFYGAAGAGDGVPAPGAGCGRCGSPRRGSRWRRSAAAGPSAGCPGAGSPSPSWTPRSPTRCPTSGSTGVSFLLALAGALLARLVLVRGRARLGAAGRPGRRAGAGRGAGARAVQPDRAGARDRGRGAGRRARATATTSSTTSGR